MTSDVKIKDFSSDQPLLDEDLEDAEILAYSQLQSAASDRAFKKVLIIGGLLLVGLVGLGLIELGYGRLCHDALSAKTTENRSFETLRLQRRASMIGGRKLEKRQTPDLCTTPACTAFSQMIKANLSPNYTDIDPCDDFDEYVCGGWRTNHPHEGLNQTLFQIMVNDFAIGRAIIERGYADHSPYVGTLADANRENFEKMQAAYNACMDEDAIKKAGLKPIQKLFLEKSSYSHKDNLTDALIYLAEIGVYPLVGFGAKPNPANPDAVCIHLQNPSLPRHSDDAPTIARTLNIMLETEETLADLGIATQIIELQTKLNEAQPDDKFEALKPKNFYNPEPFAEVDKLVPEISMTRLLRAFIPPSYKPTQVIVRTPDYFSQLSTILQSTSPDVLEVFFQWRIIASWMHLLDPDVFRDRESPDLATGHRPNKCLHEVATNLKDILSSFWAQSQSTPEDLLYAKRIVDDIKSVYYQRFDTYDWMGDRKNVKAKAKQKLSNMRLQIGYPTLSPDALNPVDVKARYEGLEISNDNYFENHLNFIKFQAKDQWSRLLTPADRDEWLLTAAFPNAWYRQDNTVELQAGLMKNPVFDKDLPDYISYGSFGQIAGHEICHGFDTGGILFDESGAYRPEWWDTETRAAYDNRTECFVDQYDKYTIPLLIEYYVDGTFAPDENLVDFKEYHVNGTFTLDENLVDTAGVSTAYAAWEKRHAQAPDQLLPNLPKEINSPERLFFVSSAMLWCKQFDLSDIRNLNEDQHSPNRFRIIGPLANSRPFREAFNCPVKEPTCELF